MDLFLSWFRRQTCFVLSLFLSLFNEVFLNNYWLKSSASIFDDSQVGTEIPSNWICLSWCILQTGGPKMHVRPKVCLCTLMRLCVPGQTGMKRQCLTPCRLSPGPLLRSPALLCLQGSESPCSRSQDSDGAERSLYDQCLKLTHCICCDAGITHFCKEKWI